MSSQSQQVPHLGPSVMKGPAVDYWTTTAASSPSYWGPQGLRKAPATAQSGPVNFHYQGAAR
jgi:hypothetical protein